jgi:hypothetical protein
MCNPGPNYYDNNPPKSERQQLLAAIDRLERLKDEPWCADALLVLAAARKHLQTLPNPAKFRVTATRGGRARRSDFDTRSDAVAWVTTNLWAYNSFSIDEVE